MTQRNFFDDQNEILAPNYDTRFTPAPTPSAGVFSPPTYMICINAEWWSHIGGVIMRLTELDAWKSDDIEDQRNAVEGTLLVLNEIGKRIECGDMATFELRQNPENDCQLQQTLDGGETWVTVFDYALCKSIGGGSTINITENNAYIDELNTTYDIDINLIGAKLIDNDGATNSALCHALKALILSTLQGVLQRLEDGNNQELVTLAVQGAIATVGAFIFGTPASGMATAVGTAVALASNAIINQYEENQLRSIVESEVVRQELLCCAYSAIVDTKPTEIEFNQMFDGCLGLSSDAQDMLPALIDAVQSRDVFLTFLEVASQAYDYSNVGVLTNDCENCGLWCYEFDFTIDDGGFNAPFRGQWVSGIGWTDTDDSRAPSIRNRGLFLDGPNFPDTTITRVEMLYTLQSASTSTRTARFILRNSGSSQVVQTDNDEVVEGVMVWTGETNSIDDILINIDIRQGTDVVIEGEEATVKSIKLWGIGVNPFGSDNC